jgi:hypothetical protein
MPVHIHMKAGMCPIVRGKMARVTELSKKGGVELCKQPA